MPQSISGSNKIKAEGNIPFLLPKILYSIKLDVISIVWTKRTWELLMVKCSCYGEIGIEFNKMLFCPSVFNQQTLLTKTLIL